MANTIIFELCAEDRARLDAILEALQKAAPRCDNCVRLVTDICAAKDTPKNDAQEPEAAEPEQTQPENETPTEPKAEAVEVTEEDIRSKYMALAATPKKKEAHALIKSYANKISEIPEDKRAELLEKLTALEG